MVSQNTVWESLAYGGGGGEVVFFNYNNLFKTGKKP
jgi:hypothetical protein